MVDRMRQSDEPLEDRQEAFRRSTREKILRSELMNIASSRSSSRSIDRFSSNLGQASKHFFSFFDPFFDTFFDK
jgi:hypothetical protein